jgi:hypothetical protein
MTRGKRRGTTLILLACVGAALAAAITARGQTGPAQIRITDIQVSYHVARPLRGGRAGMVEAITQRLYNPSLSRKAIGRGVITCTYANSRTRNCVATYVLPKGTLVATGAVDSRLFYELPIVGGTGLYDNARGTLTVTATHLRPRREVLLFRLVG